MPGRDSLAAGRRAEVAAERYLRDRGLQLVQRNFRCRRGEIDLIIFLWDPMQPHPHDVDVKALLRIAVLYNIPTACNRSTADFMISSPIFNARYEPEMKDYSGYIKRVLSIESEVL